MRKLPIDQLSALFQAIAEKEALYIPADDSSGQARFQRWHEGMEMTHALNTVRSAKDFFFPQTENLVDFKLKGKEIEVIDPRTEHEDFVVFGVRGCDARSFTILDKVFLAEPVDTYYKSRREHGTIVSLACTHPEETCFCSTFGIDPAAPEGDAPRLDRGRQPLPRGADRKGREVPGGRGGQDKRVRGRGRPRPAGEDPRHRQEAAPARAQPHRL